MIKDVLQANPELNNDLFIRGFVITTDENIDSEGFPFNGLWKRDSIGKWNIMLHPLTGYGRYSKGEYEWFIFGHAYNPFTMEIDETKILERLAENYGKDENGQLIKEFRDALDEITGIYLLGCVKSDGSIEYVVDPTGMQSACNGVVNGNVYISSHAQLVGDINGLGMDAFVKELVQYKWFRRVMGPYLPADLTAFSELKRIVPNSWYICNSICINHKRFWPIEAQAEALSVGDYNDVIRHGADILKNNMELISRKWEHPWISLTGGIDSNTTFAAANGLYDKYETFSYISAEKEIRDAEAAERIANRFNIKHNVFNIPTENEAVENYEEIRQVLEHNNGYITNVGGNECRKRIVLRREAECDVEVKSWVSETIRCYWYKHYGRHSMPQLSAKLYRNLYKIFLTNRRLAHRIDKIFEKFIIDYEFDRIPACYPTADIHYNDVTWGSWGGLNISEMKYCFDITIAYNNRKFLNLMFRVPLEKRIDDTHHLDMKKYLNKDLYDMGIRVVNMKETDLRAFLLNIVFTVNTILPF